MDWQAIISELRKRGLTQQQIAERCDCAQSTISDLARGAIKSPSYGIGVSLMKIARRAAKAKAEA